MPAFQSLAFVNLERIKLDHPVVQENGARLPQPALLPEYEGRCNKTKVGSTYKRRYSCR